MCFASCERVIVFVEKLMCQKIFTSSPRFDQIKGGEMGRVYSAHGTDEKYKKLLESLKGKDHSEDLGIDGRIIVKYNLRK
jgi:hypothetical protein